MQFLLVPVIREEDKVLQSQPPRDLRRTQLLVPMPMAVGTREISGPFLAESQYCPQCRVTVVVAMCPVTDGSFPLPADLSFG